MSMQFCRSRNEGRRCTRERGHRGLHRQRTILWTDAGADAPHCPGSGSAGAAAAVLASGFPHGQALCATCLGFVARDAAGRLVEHDTGGTASDSDAADRAEWFNTNGWSDA